MFSENANFETKEILTFIRINLNKSLSNEEFVVNYLKANYSLTDRTVDIYIKVIKAEWN